jgi:hypothetical protein
VEACLEEEELKILVFLVPNQLSQQEVYLELLASELVNRNRVHYLEVKSNHLQEASLVIHP